MSGEAMITTSKLARGSGVLRGARLGSNVSRLPPAQHPVVQGPKDPVHPPRSPVDLLVSQCGAAARSKLNEMTRPTDALSLKLACRDALVSAGWAVKQNVPIGPSPKGGVHTADLLALWPTTGKKIAVYPRWQSSSGTAEEKIPFQIIKTQFAVKARPDSIQAAYFVLEGTGWTYRDFYFSGELGTYISLRIPTHCLALVDLQERTLQ